MAQDLSGRSAIDNGLQVTRDDDRGEKYPAVLVDAPKIPIATDAAGLCLTSIEGTKNQSNTACGFPGDAEHAGLGTRLRKRKVCIVVAIACSVIIGACVGGVFGTRKGGSTPTNKPTPTKTLTATNASPTLFSQGKAYPGTSFAATAYPHSADHYYILFYQHANGDIRKCVYNGTSWHKATYVTNDARMGTGLTTAWTSSASGPLLWLCYIDKANRLQELRGTHTSDTWTRGTLGNSNFEAASNHSTRSMQYVSDCYGGLNAWFFYQTSDGAIRQVWWNSTRDNWLAGTNFTGVEHQSGFVTFLWYQARWRIFMMSTLSCVVQYICNNCCERDEWKQDVGYEFRDDSRPFNGIGTINAGSRRLRYQTSDGLIRTLNSSGDPGNETFEPSPLTIGKAKLGTMMAIADGSIFGQPVKAFYQANRSDVTVTSWRMDAVHLRTTEQLLLTP